MEVLEPYSTQWVEELVSSPIAEPYPSEDQHRESMSELKLVYEKALANLTDQKQQQKFLTSAQHFLKTEAKDLMLVYYLNKLGLEGYGESGIVQSVNLYSKLLSNNSDHLYPLKVKRRLTNLDAMSKHLLSVAKLKDKYLPTKFHEFEQAVTTFCDVVMSGFEQSDLIKVKQFQKLLDYFSKASPTVETPLNGLESASSASGSPDLNTSKKVVLQQPIIKPILVENPVGEDLANSEAFFDIKNIASNSNSSSQAVDWGHWVMVGLEFLEHQSKDLRVATYYCLCQYKAYQLPGLIEALDHLKLLLETFQDRMHPARTKGKIVQIEWLNTKISDQIKRTEFSQKNLDDLTLALERLADLNVAIEHNQLCDVGGKPLYKITKALEHHQNQLLLEIKANQQKSSVQSEKQMSDSVTKNAAASQQNPVSQVESNSEPSLDESKTAAITTSTPTPTPTPTTSSKASASVVTAEAGLNATTSITTMSIETASDVRQFFKKQDKTIIAIQQLWLKATQEDPRPYRLIRMWLWSESPAVIAPNLRGPSEQIQKEVEALYQSENWPLLIEKCETLLYANRFWLDLSFYTYIALQAQGFNLAAEGIVDALKVLQARTRNLLEGTFDDDLPYCNETTKQWLQEKVITANLTQQTQVKGGKPSEQLKATVATQVKVLPLNWLSQSKVHQEALAKVDADIEKGAIDRVQQELIQCLRQTASPRERFVFHLKILELLGQQESLEPIEWIFSTIYTLDEQTSQYNIAQWDPDLALAFSGLVVSIAQRIQSKIQEDEKQLPEKIVAIVTKAQQQMAYWQPCGFGVVASYE